MKTVREAMAIGRTFKEALQKALRSLETKRFGLCGDGNEKRVDAETLRLKLAIPNAERIFHLAQAFQDGMSIEEVFELTKIDRWFLHNVRQIGEEAQRRSGYQPDSADRLPACPSPSPATLFQPFDEQTKLQQTKRHLPHWEQEGATYFVTFRLIDAVAQEVLAQWREEREQWLKRHPQPWDWRTAREYMRMNEESREEWLDRGHGSCLLRTPACDTRSMSFTLSTQSTTRTWSSRVPA